ncbi:DNA -binding domain-containing protein, partial [Escherichia coli]
GLFDAAPISKRDWISHELRDQTGRLVRLGFKLMRGGYRQLLVYPYRRRI